TSIFIRQEVLYTNHILHGNAFCNTYYQTNTCFRSFHDGICCKGRGNKYDAHICAGSFYAIGHGIKYRTIQMRASAFTWRYTTYYLCAVLNHLGGVESTFRARKSLNQNLRLLIHQYTHETCFNLKSGAKIGQMFEKALSKSVRGIIVRSGGLPALLPSFFSWHPAKTRRQK